MFQENEWEAFIGILVSETSDANDAGVSLPNWISSDRGPFLAKLKANFPTLYDTLQLNDNSIWSAFSRGQMSDEEELPVQLAKKMTPFQKVFVTAKRILTRKTWNTDFIIICQNLIGLYS